MFKQILEFFTLKNSDFSEEATKGAASEFDALMVTVEEDQNDLRKLERHLDAEFFQINENVKEDCNGVDQAVNKF